MIKITKITEDFDFKLENNRYVLDYGNLRVTSKREVVFKIEGTNLQIVPQCGCTTSDKIEESGNTLVTIKYKNCDSSFGKIIDIYDELKNKTQLKLKGTCQK